MGFNSFSFRGGVHPPDNKHFTENKPIETAKVPSLVYIPLQQHIGAPCEALVKPGDHVKLGQMIGQQRGFVCAPVHASVSGKVKSVMPMMGPQGVKVMTVVIENDGLDTLDESIKPRDIESLSVQDIRRIILDGGIVGMGGATFLTHVKLSPPAEKEIEYVILNGAECEPYLTSDHRLMIEQPDQIIAGLKIIMRVIDAKFGYIGIEDNKSEAIEVMEKVTKKEPNIQVVALKTKYPQGSEKQLIQTITGRQVPSGGLPADVGVEVNNVATAAKIYEVLTTGMPFIERVVTISGKGIKEPKNLMVRIGTLFSELIEECGGFSCEPSKIIAGGPMTGIAQHTLEVPVTKGVTGILALSPEETKDEEVWPCIRCGKCIQVCPINLMPLSISAYSLKGDFDTCKEYKALDCIECGCCSYICPAKRPLMQSIIMAKNQIIAKEKNNTSNEQ